MHPANKKQTEIICPVIVCMLFLKKNKRYCGKYYVRLSRTTDISPLMSTLLY